MIPSTPNLQAWADQYYGVMKFRLLPDGYTWDYESAMESPTAPAGHAADLRRQGRRHLQRAARLLKTAAWGRHPPAPHAYPTGGNRGGGDR